MPAQPMNSVWATVVAKAKLAMEERIARGDPIDYQRPTDDALRAHYADHKLAGERKP